MHLRISSTKTNILILLIRATTTTTILFFLRQRKYTCQFFLRQRKYICPDGMTWVVADEMTEVSFRRLPALLCLC